MGVFPKKRKFINTNQHLQPVTWPCNSLLTLLPPHTWLTHTACMRTVSDSPFLREFYALSKCGISSFLNPQTATSHLTICLVAMFLNIWHSLSWPTLLLERKFRCQSSVLGWKKKKDLVSVSNEMAYEGMHKVWRNLRKAQERETTGRKP